MTASGINTNIEQFNSSMNVDNWLDRLIFSFIALGIIEEPKKRAVFLTNVSPEVFKLIKNIVHPQKLEDRSFADLTKMLKEHLSPTPNTIMERFK